MRAAAPRSAAAAASASASSARATPSTAPKELRRRRLGSACHGALPWVGVLGCGATGCELGGPGGDRDFTGAKRSGPRCVPGPLASLAAGQRLNVSLWPTGGSWPE